MRPMMATLLGRRGGVSLNIFTTSVSDSQVAPSTAKAYIELQSDGDTLTNSGANPDWLNGSTAGSDWECRATIVSGTPSSGTTGSWLALSSSRSWDVTRASLGTKKFEFLLEIRDAATQTIQGSGTITLSATVTPAA